MRTMLTDFMWQEHPPATTPAIAACLSEPGSLTERLLASGRRFDVQVLFQSDNTALDQEAVLLGIAPHAVLHARHVLLLLDGIPVVMARSVCRSACPQWSALLDRGSRSLGLTLFGGLPQLVRGPLRFNTLQQPDALHALVQAHSQAEQLPARRCLFTLHDAPLLVSEIFLPELESLA
ncbi:chorismate lyase [Rhodobacteraceae bacterium CH30]|uniref:Chorismate lyase n=2 Tax=Craterilacuibacter sinensis TaxID=2686017 RepID=A0A845BZ34_9NEIS|nr:chorismate lyase [Craterilacuibacter sinensis]RQW27304.1 chorismate lyase [Rhodobacteraceae bacterium CH30]